jgi:phosphoribosylanthranilate isomerase
MVKIKICGITNSEDYNNAAGFNVDYAGFIFFKGSKRFIDPIMAYEIIKNNVAKNITKVGVFVNEEIERIREIYYSVGLDIIQLHGDESPNYCRKLELPFWKVIRVKDRNSIELTNDYGCDTFLLDTYSKNKFGGTGISFDLSIASDAIQTGKKIIIAGGISIQNIESILKLSPYAVDINSSVEMKPGKKDITKMKQIIEIIKNTRY